MLKGGGKQPPSFHQGNETRPIDKTPKRRKFKFIWFSVEVFWGSEKWFWSINFKIQCLGTLYHISRIYTIYSWNVLCCEIRVCEGKIIYIFHIILGNIVIGQRLCSCRLLCNNAKPHSFNYCIRTARAEPLPYALALR